MSRSQMMTRRLFVFFLLAPCIAAGVELDLFVTDPMEDPSQTQRPLVDRPSTYWKPADVVVRTGEGKRVVHEGPARVIVERVGAGDPQEARIFASRGEVEPFSFLLRPKETIEAVFINPSDLKGPAGTIPARNVVVASVEGFHGGGRDILVKLGRRWNMAAHSTEFFWCMVTVPQDASPGNYRGTVTVTSTDAPIGTISVVLEVMPIELGDVPYAVGFNYSNPGGEKVLEAHLADMREHGMTTVGPLYGFHLPVHDTDTKELGDFIEAYKRAGFPGPLYFATPMNLHLSELAGYGSEASKRWQQKYIKVMRLLHGEVARHDVPVIMSIGDELTNKGIEGVRIAEELARFVWEELPEIAAASDMNGYMEVMAMAPYLNVAAFNNGWDGIDHHNKGRHLINKGFIREVEEKTGAIPWFVNGGIGRFPFGFFLWKMAKYGVRGKVEWYYNLTNERGSIVRTDGAMIYPTLDYERCREGVDDLRYLSRLERLVEQAKGSERAAADRRDAEALLERIAGGIEDDWTAYQSGGARFPPDDLQVLDPKKAVGMGPFDVVRRAVADRIVALQAVLK